MRVASVMRERGASIRPASNHPPRRPNTSRRIPKTAAAGAKSRKRAPRPGLMRTWVSWTKTISPLGTYRSRNTHTAPRSKPPAIMRKPA